MKHAPREDIVAVGREVRAITRGTGTLFIVNDDPAIAAEVEADGVHVGQDDMPVAEVRARFPSLGIVGLSTHSPAQALAGEFLTHAMLDFARNADPTRLVNGPSGCWDWEGGRLLPNGWQAWDKLPLTQHKPAGVCEAADTVDAHLYRGPQMFAVNDRRISFLGEFGGLGHPVPGHLWKPGGANWGCGGNKDTATREDLEKTYLGLMAKLGDLVEKGLGGSVYTQTTDVEIEINGLMTYDRKVLKYNPAVLKAAHEAIIRRATSNR